MDDTITIKSLNTDITADAKRLGFKAYGECEGCQAGHRHLVESQTSAGIAYLCGECHAVALKTPEPPPFASMDDYRITSMQGVDLGTYRAHSEEGAYREMLGDAGYSSSEDVPGGVGGMDRVIVTKVEADENADQEVANG